MQIRYYLLVSIVSMFCFACSSSEKKVGDGTDLDRDNEVPNSVWVEGVFSSSEDYAQVCETPRRSGDYNDVQGTSMDEKMWLRSMSNELYLWNDQLVDNNPYNYTVEGYFHTLKIPSDRFHFTIPTEDYLQGSQSGIYFGYGITWATLNDEGHSFGVGEIEASANIPSAVKRGDAILGADGVYVDEAYDENLSESERSILVDTLNAAVFPAEVGESHDFYLRDRDTGEEKVVTLTAANVTHNPVPIAKEINTASGNVGYIQFNDHNTASEVALVDAVTDLAELGVDDLILDLRYNGGGYIYIASMLSYMISGPGNTSGETFTQLKFNRNAGDTDPFTGNKIEPIPFYDDDGSGEILPSLNLDRVFVLTSDSTCSASELIMNGLAGVGVEVIQIGNTTCGKPYSFYPLENCGTMYFTVMSENVNAKGFSDYSGGFSASENNYSEDDVFQGCVVDDDFTHDLGDEEEAMLSAAIEFVETDSCPAVPLSGKKIANHKQTLQIFAAQARRQRAVSIMRRPSVIQK